MKPRSPKTKSSHSTTRALTRDLTTNLAMGNASSTNERMGTNIRFTFELRLVKTQRDIIGKLSYTPASSNIVQREKISFINLMESVMYFGIAQRNVLVNLAPLITNTHPKPYKFHLPLKTFLAMPLARSAKMPLLFIFRQISQLHSLQSEAAKIVPAHGHVANTGIHRNAAQIYWTGLHAYPIDHINIA